MARIPLSQIPNVLGSAGASPVTARPPVFQAGGRPASASGATRALEEPGGVTIDPDRASAYARGEAQGALMAGQAWARSLSQVGDELYQMGVEARKTRRAFQNEALEGELHHIYRHFLDRLSADPDEWKDDWEGQDGLRDRALGKVLQDLKITNRNRAGVGDIIEIWKRETSYDLGHRQAQRTQSIAYAEAMTNLDTAMERGDFERAHTIVELMSNRGLVGGPDAEQFHSRITSAAEDHEFYMATDADPSWGVERAEQLREAYHTRWAWEHLDMEGPPAPGQSKVSRNAFIKGLEGFTASAQWDVRQHSVGYGTRGEAGEQLTKEEAEQRLNQELAGHEAALDGMISQLGYRFTEDQRTALTSFAFNAGNGWLGWALGLNEGKRGGFAPIENPVKRSDEEIASAMGQILTDSPDHLEGVRNRRGKEIALFQGAGDSKGGSRQEELERQVSLARIERYEQYASNATKKRRLNDILTFQDTIQRAKATPGMDDDRSILTSIDRSKYLTGTDKGALYQMMQGKRQTTGQALHLYGIVREMAISDLEDESNFLDLSLQIRTQTQGEEQEILINRLAMQQAPGSSDWGLPTERLILAAQDRIHESALGAFKGKSPDQVSPSLTALRNKVETRARFEVEQYVHRYRPQQGDAGFEKKVDALVAMFADETALREGYRQFGGEPDVVDPLLQELLGPRLTNAKDRENSVEAADSNLDAAETVWEVGHSLLNLQNPQSWFRLGKQLMPGMSLSLDPLPEWEPVLPPPTKEQQGDGKPDQEPEEDSELHREKQPEGEQGEQD